jgi:hypothetical protein
VTRVVLTCPLLNIDIVSNLDAERRHLSSLATPGEWQLACPACGKRHSWLASRPRIMGAATTSYASSTSTDRR